MGRRKVSEAPGLGELANMLWEEFGQHCTSKTACEVAMRVLRQQEELITDLREMAAGDDW